MESIGSRMSRSVALLMATVPMLCTVAESSLAASVVLNGLKIEIDDDTGTLLRLSHPDTGVVLEASKERSSILTVSAPAPGFTALQLEPRLSKATISPAKDAVTLTWDALQANRSSKLGASDGNIRAEVTFRAAPDGKSVILRAQVRNLSQLGVSQILFPDLQGLRPFDKPERMELRMALGAVNPFADGVRPEGRATFYPHGMWREYPSDAQYQRNALRWMDYGSLKGGISLFEKQWLTDPRPSILTNRNEADPNELRIAWQHRVAVPPGGNWQSAEYWLTPHRGGWAKGIEPFREYAVAQNIRKFPVPDRIRDGIGFQTIWMMQGAETDASRVVYRATDLLRVARDAKEHGIDEIVLWGWCRYGQLPVRIHPAVGTFEELAQAIREAKQIGVNITPFVNLKNLDNSNGDVDVAARYGLTPGSGSAWIYHPEAIPTMLPFTAASGQVDVPTNNKVWGMDAAKALSELIRHGITSFAFDVYDDAGSLALIEWTNGVRAEARKVDPDATFAAEPVNGSFERSSRTLDYTWNWMDYVEAGPLQNVLRYPRININAERSSRVVKMAFADGLYINAMPKAPNQPNGTRLIGEEPELAAALKEVAPLRRQFLEFFRDGHFLGESVLAEPVSQFTRRNHGSWIGGATIEVGPFEYPDIFVRGHQLQDRLLIVVLNNDATPRSFDVNSDLSLWLPKSKAYRVVQYDGTGKASAGAHRVWGASWRSTVAGLPPLGLTFFEISPDR
jgi:hypothetical protein